MISKFRILYASAHNLNSLSLNGCIHSGPDLYPDTYGTFFAVLISICYFYNRHEAGIFTDIST